MSEKNLLEQLVEEIEDEAKDIKEFDTGVIINDDFDTIYIKDGKVSFNGHDLKWALEKSNPFTLYNALLLVKDLVKGEKVVNEKKQDMMDLFNKIYG